MFFFLFVFFSFSFHLLSLLFPQATSFAELYCCREETADIPSCYSIVSVLQYMWLLDVREDRGGFRGICGRCLGKNEADGDMKYSLVWSPREEVRLLSAAGEDGAQFLVPSSALRSC